MTEDTYTMARRAMETHDFELMLFVAGMLFGENLELRSQIKELEENKLVYQKPTDRSFK